MKHAKAMTIRLSAEQARDLETVSMVDEQPVSEVIRAAIAEHLASRRMDPRFRNGLEQRIQQARNLLGPDRS